MRRIRVGFSATVVFIAAVGILLWQAAPWASPPALPFSPAFSHLGHTVQFKAKHIVVAAKDRRLQIELVNARAEFRPVAAGDSSHAPPGPAFPGVTCQDPWPGITVDYLCQSDAILKSTYSIRAGLSGRPVEQIRIRYSHPVELESSGKLVIRFPQGAMRESAPVAWQVINGTRQPVKAAFRVLSEKEVGFEAAYDPRFPLVIDPALTWHTFLGGSAIDIGNAVCADSSGNVYVTGQSTGTWGTPVRAYTLLGDAWVAKLDSSGTLLWHTFLGGAGNDSGNGIAVDASGNVYVAGHSEATWGTTPLRAYTGNADAFAAKLDSSGGLVWHTFLGGSGADYNWGITVDNSGNVWLSGYGNATWGTPVSAYTAGNDALVMALASNGSLSWHTFLGGSGNDTGRGIGRDSSGNLYISGTSAATWGTPLRAYTAGEDALVIKTDSSGNLTWHTFLGGTASDGGGDIAVSSGGIVAIAGQSDATWGTPVRAYTASTDAFTAVLAANGSLSWHSFLGGTGYDYGRGIAWDNQGDVVVVGQSDATWGTPWRGYAAAYDIFMVLLASDGTFNWNAFFGGASQDFAYGAAADASGYGYAVGYSGATWGSPVRAYTASSDGVVVKVQITGPTPTVTPSRTASATPTQSLTITPTPTTSPTPSVTQSATPSGTQTLTATISITPSVTPTLTASHTRTLTATISQTATESATRTPTPTSTPSISATLTQTLTFTRTPTGTITETISPTPTLTSTPTLGDTPTITLTATSTPSTQATRTHTQTPVAVGSGKVLVYPMPARGGTVWFYFNAENPGIAKIQIYNVTGESGITLTRSHNAGPQRVSWDIRDVAGGVYFYRLTLSTANGTEAFDLGKLVIVK